MAKTKVTARKSTGPHGVPHHQLAPRNHELGEGSSKTLGDEGSSSNPANNENQAHGYVVPTGDQGLREVQWTCVRLSWSFP